MPRRARTFTPEPDVAWDDPRTIKAAAKLELATRAADVRYRTDPWAFLTECVSTLDQIDGKVKLFPGKPHLEWLTRCWEVEKLLAVPKSRRMLVTWWGVGVNYWLARYRPGQKIAFLARKEGKNESEGSAELVWRAKFIHDHLPTLLPPIATEYTVGRLLLLHADAPSEIIGVPQGSDQLRQMTLSSILADEMAFWEWAYDTYVALRPTIEGGGRLTCVSSANPGTFKAICYDELHKAA